MLDKFVLGTAQLTQNYGINNKSKNFSQRNSFNILEASLQEGICKWDTSPQYGESEKIIGKFLKKEMRSKIKISTKLPSINKHIGVKASSDDLEAFIDKFINQSLKNLNIDKIDVYYIHDEKDLKLFGNILIQILLEKHYEKKINKIGISLYDLDLIKLSKEYSFIEFIQLPINIFDNKHIFSINYLANKNVNFVARSIFLQGLFFMDPKIAKIKVPQSFDYLNKLVRFSKEHDLSISEISIRYVKSITNSSDILIGVDNINQLTKNIEIFKKEKLSNQIIKKLDKLFYKLPKGLTDPRKWN